MLLVLFLIVMIDLIGFGIIIPLLPFYGETFGAGPFQVGMLMATYSLAQLVAAPVLGRLSDRLGRRPVLLVSLAGAALSYVWLGLAESLWALFAARAFGGFMAGNIATAFAYVTDITTPEQRSKGMGLMGAAFSLGFIFGPAIGGVLAGPDAANANYHLPAFTAAVMSGVALVLAVWKLRESLSPEIRARRAALPRKGVIRGLVEAASRPLLGTLILMTFLTTLVFAGMEATFAMWSSRQFGWGPQQNGLLFATVGLLAAGIQGGLIHRLSLRFGDMNLVVAGCVLLGLGFAMIPFSTELPVLIAAMALLAIGFSVANPPLNSLVSHQAGDEERGEIMGANRAASTLARVVGPVWAGWLFATLGKDWPYFGGALLIAVVAVIAVRYRRRVRDRG